jgi:hypothetical protein
MFNECDEVRQNAGEHIIMLVRLWEEKMFNHQWEEAENVLADINAATGQMLVATQICERNI